MVNFEQPMATDILNLVFSINKFSFNLPLSINKVSNKYATIMIMTL